MPRRRLQHEIEAFRSQYPIHNSNTDTIKQAMIHLYEGWHQLIMNRQRRPSDDPTEDLIAYLRDLFFLGKQLTQAVEIVIRRLANK